MALEPVRKAQKDSSNCAIFGALSFGEKPLTGNCAVRGICEAESARGGTYGNGVMLAHAERGQRGKNLCIWARTDVFAERIRGILEEEGVRVGEINKGQGQIYQAKTEAEYIHLLSAVIRANSQVGVDDGRIISFGHGLTLYKGLESLSEQERIYGFGEMPATGMIAHTRYPTGSEPKVARAHPFGFGNVGIVHNGDVTSYRANLAACESRLAELYHNSTKNGVDSFIAKLRKSWVGTDSEVIAGMIYTMLKTGLMSEPGLSISGILSALVPAFDNHITQLLRGSAERARLDAIAKSYRGFGLDGPVSSIALITYEDEVQLLAFRDRNTFRPLQIVIDHEDGRVFVASELRQIEAATGLDIFSPKVEAYSPEPGKFLWASSRSGIIESGRSRRPFISAPSMDRKTAEGRLRGEPNQFAGERITGHRIYAGTLGSHGASYTDGDGTLEIVGPMQDNCLEASSVRKVVCHANAGMMHANAFQGEYLFHRGSLDSRGCQQLRPKDGHEPFVVIGETVGQYFMKMASGGTGLVLGLGHLGREDVDTPIAGDFLGTGMVGGRIYVRSDVKDSLIKRPPQGRDVIAACAQLKEEGLITESALKEIRLNPLSLPRIKKILEGSRLRASDPDSVTKAMRRLQPLFDASLRVERRGLNPQEIAFFTPALEEYWAAFSLPATGLRIVLHKSLWTVVSNEPAQE
ncbi:MAG TPA: hypothetical protein VLD37_00940 [Candidatus Bilamarchaeum sp.]|nr:hypothetical protein [Candidatus Bilamarchaeum sp.]